MAQVRKQNVVAPLAIERNERVRNAAVPARDQHLRTAVGTEQHQIRAGIKARRMEDFGPDRVGIVAVTRLADIDDIVIHERGAGGKRSEQRNEQEQEESQMGSASGP
ncbi:MAG: hypothetical protein DME19_07255 [Verrucomicrobia bacterium]|nr:MAG: hypothetical protein DME19_07255 [Verrucomicrobiota bacterium]